MKKYICAASDHIHKSAFNADEDRRSKIARTTDNIDLLNIYAYDPSYIVRRCVAKNKHTTADILDYLANDCDSVVQEYVASHQNTSTEALRRLVDVDNYWVTLNATANDNAPIEEFAHHPDPAVRAGVAGCMTTPEQVLRLLAEDPDVQVREEVAHNLSTPIDVLEILANDGSVAVRAEVEDNPNFRGTINWEW